MLQYKRSCIAAAAVLARSMPTATLIVSVFSLVPVRTEQSYAAEFATAYVVLYSLRYYGSSGYLSSFKYSSKQPSDIHFFNPLAPEFSLKF